MQHNQNTGIIFVQPPMSFTKDTPRAELQYCLGATLYMPGTKKVLDKLLGKGMADLGSMVMDFEDALRVEDVPAAETNVLQHLTALAKAQQADATLAERLPLIFLRVRSPRQFEDFARLLTPAQAAVLSGFVFPKFDSENAQAFFDVLIDTRTRLQCPLYGMPILEGTRIAYRETRMQELFALKTILDAHRELILNLRIGGTDFSALFGVRRGINHSIYDILPVRDCLSDILNVFNRSNDGYTLSAPVWESFLVNKKDSLEQVSARHIHQSLLNRVPIVNEVVDGLLREVLLDQANGFVGKTIIHPSHLKYVNAMQAITQEAFEDATQILNTDDGVVKGLNKMNEVRPHRHWAKRTLMRARAYGVIESEASYMKMLLK